MIYHTAKKLSASIHLTNLKVHRSLDTIFKNISIKNIFDKNGGGGWIRTTESVANRFTVCPLWPLGNSSIIISNLILYGAGDRNRTYNLLITNQLLYR